MENKVIVYDKILEIREALYQDEANELLSEYVKIDDTTCLVWDVISCVCSYYPPNETIKRIYTLGKRYKRIDHTNN